MYPASFIRPKRVHITNIKTDSDVKSLLSLQIVKHKAKHDQRGEMEGVVRLRFQNVWEKVMQI